MRYKNISRCGAVSMRAWVGALDLCTAAMKEERLMVWREKVMWFPTEARDS